MRPVPEQFDSSGCFETIRVENGRPVDLREHMQRIRGSLHALAVDFSGQDGLTAEIRKEARRIGSGYVRVAVSRYGEKRKILHSSARTPYAPALQNRGVRLRTVPTRCPSGETSLSLSKHSERLSSILARCEGGKSFDVLRFGSHGFLTEGTVSNFFFVKEGTLFTPPLWIGVLEGVMRGKVLQAARRLKIPVREVPVTRHDLFNADEAFITNVLMKLLPVLEVDGRRIGEIAPGPVTHLLMSKLRGKNATIR